MPTHDVLVIGAGLAGQRAALAAAEEGVSVAILSKVHPVRSHSNAAQGGINAALNPEDSWESHAFDTVKGSDYLGDQDAIEVMCREAPHELLHMEHLGVTFHRNDEGKLGTRAFGGASAARTYYVADITGQALLHVLYEQLMKHQEVERFEEWFTTSLLVADDGRIAGCVARNIRDGRMELFSAKAVILAMGGNGQVFNPTTNALICTGDGHALAYRVGAPLMDMEMVQYHPTTLAGNGLLITEGARGEGAHLYNAQGERFMEKYAPNKMELASRDVVSRAEQTEINEGRGFPDGTVALDITVVPKKRIHEALREIVNVGRDFAGVDITSEPIHIKPGNHYIMGGVKTDIDGRTSIPGLYAAGEVACVSVHGGNRLGANSLLDTLIFGRRSGVDAARVAHSVSQPKTSWSSVERDEGQINEIIGRPKDGRRVSEIKAELGAAMDKHVAVFRDEAGLQQALEVVQRLKEEAKTVWVDDKGTVFNQDVLGALELGFMIDNAEAIVLGAIERKESRGAQFRTDYPDRNDEEWLKHIVVTQTDGGPKLSYAPVTLTKWEPEERQVLMPDYGLKIYRYNPETGNPPSWDDFDVDLPDHMSVLDGVLQARAKQDGSIGIRCSCQAAICGSCAVRINGKTRLACNTKIGEAADEARENGVDRIVVEPMGNYPVLKDLIVDMDAVHWKKIQRVVPWLLPDGPPPEREYIVPAESMIDITQSMACIQCGACVGACLSLEVDPDFIGPAALAKAYRFVGDPRDGATEERLRDLAEDPHGLYDCTHCFACIEVCPKDVAPMSQIMRLRRRATQDYGVKDRNNGYGHEKAFVNIIEKWGTLHEAQLLPRSFGEGSLVKGQLSPNGQKNLAGSLPTVLRGLASGKVSPKKALIHPKLPDQDQVRRIFKEIESKDERLELNLYIVGESGGDEEGATAEGSQES